MPWNATTPSAEASFAAYFRQIVTAMRSVSGEQFRFVWNPDAGAFTQSGYSVAAAYPGNAYVDVIGLDAYDQSWATPQTPANAWASTTLPSLTAAQQFASSNGKPLAFCEWGVAIRSDGHGLGDDPYYVNQMVAWMQSQQRDLRVLLRRQQRRRQLPHHRGLVPQQPGRLLGRSVGRSGRTGPPRPAPDPERPWSACAVSASDKSRHNSLSRRLRK